MFLDYPSSFHFSIPLGCSISLELLDICGFYDFYRTLFCIVEAFFLLYDFQHFSTLYFTSSERPYQAL